MGNTNYSFNLLQSGHKKAPLFVNYFPELRLFFGCLNQEYLLHLVAACETLHIWENINQFIGSIIFLNVVSKVTQISLSQACEVHPHCANDANKANDWKKKLYSSFMSAMKQEQHLCSLGQYWMDFGFRGLLVRFENLFSFLFFHIREEVTGAVEKKQAEDCLESETHFKGFPQKPDCEIWDETS